MVVLRDCLSGEKAFYSKNDYVVTTRRDLKSEEMPIAFEWNTESKTMRVFKLILAIIIFPIGIYLFIHCLVGKLVVRSSSSAMRDFAGKVRSGVSLQEEWKYKRIAIKVDGYVVDAMIMGRESTLGNGRWILASNGNFECYEQKLLSCSNFRRIVSLLNANALLFNYPGVGASSGMPNRWAMRNTYIAMLEFLRKIGATEVIGYGQSLGGAVQGDALKEYQLDKRISYVFVKNRTFSDLSTLVSLIFNRFIGFLVKILGWNIDSVHSSSSLKAHEIIMATTDYKGEIAESDGVIPREASLATALLKNKRFPYRKAFIGTHEEHNDLLTLSTLNLLRRNVEGFLHLSTPLSVSA